MHVLSEFNYFMLKLFIKLIDNKLEYLIGNYEKFLTILIRFSLEKSDWEMIDKRHNDNQV